MTIDLFTSTLMTALVSIVAGIVFIIDTLLRRDDGAGRIWSIGFLSGMSTTIAYALWADGAGGILAVAIGNALFVATAGCMWLGSRRFNERQMPWAVAVVVTGCLAVAGAAVIREGDGSGWGGWLVMSLVLISFLVCAAVESLRRPMGRIGTAWVLAVVFAVAAAFYIVRVSVFLVAGPESELFQTVFGTVVANGFTVVVTIVAVIATSVLRAPRAELRTYAWVNHVGVTSDGLMLAPTFASALRDVVERAEWRDELVAVISVRIQDLAQIRRAFGADVAGEVVHAWRQGVRRFAPSMGLVGEDGEDALLVVTRSATASEARRQAATIYRGLFDSFGSLSGSVLPAVGVGVTLSEMVGYDTSALVDHAREASLRAVTSVESSVLFGGPTDADVSR